MTKTMTKTMTKREVEILRTLRNAAYSAAYIAARSDDADLTVHTIAIAAAKDAYVAAYDASEEFKNGVNAYHSAPTYAKGIVGLDKILENYNDDE